jgi:hypothetical protein
MRRSLPLALLLSVCACSPRNDEPLQVDTFTPAAASFRSPSRVTLEGTGFDRDVKVQWGDAQGKLLSVTPERLEVELPAVTSPRRAQLVLSRRGEEARTALPYVGHVQPPEAWHLSPGPALPVPATRLVRADLDGDGSVEFFVTGPRGTGPVTAGTSAAETWLPTPDKAPLQLAAARLDGRDVVLAQTAEGLELYAQGEDGGLSRTPLEGARGLVLGNGGCAAVTTDGGTQVARLAGTASAPTLEPLLPLPAFEPVSVLTADADGDGRADLLLGGKTAGPRLLLADGAGHFRDAPAGTLDLSVPGPARLADLDADGELDIVVAAATGDVALRRAGGRYLDRTALLLGRTDTRAAFEADLDGDAAVDRVGGNGALQLLRNDGQGAFYDYTFSVARPWSSSTPLLAEDADGDGDLDLLVREDSGRVRWLLNVAPASFADADGDGIHDAADNCPSRPNPDQRNQDAHPFSCADALCTPASGCQLGRVGSRAVLACAASATFAEAQASCRDRGAQLLLPLDEAESKAAGALLGTQWLDLTDAATEGTFLTALESAPTWTNWASGEPNDSGGAQDCGVVRADGSWDDVGCDTKRAFSCVEAGTRTGDGRGDACDVCPLLSDPAQADADGDGKGDACTGAVAP